MEKKKEPNIWQIRKRRDGKGKKEGGGRTEILICSVYFVCTGLAFKVKDA
jgi:hypothetical protein